MLKVLDYFNLSDLYKFIPEDQKIADAGSSGPDDSKSDQEKSLPVLVEGNDDDDDDKWTILGNRSSTKTLYTSFRRNRNVSSTLCESKPEVTQLQRASSQHQNLVSSTQSLTPRDNQTYRHKQQDIYYDSTPLKHMRPQQIADKSRYIDISQSPSGPVLSSSYTGGYSSSSSYDGNTPTDSNEDGSHLGTPCISESLLEFTDSPSVTPTGFHLQDQSSSHSSQSSSKSPSPLLSELPAAATASEVEKGEDALEDREGDIRLSYAREYPNVSITIVGHESNGILLMCVHNGKQTFLNKFSMKDLNAQCLCTWDYKANITCATIDESQRVVAVSMRETVDVRKVDGDKKLQELLQSCHSTHVTIYSSYVQCVNDNTGKIQRVGEMSLHPQEVHFTCKNDGGTMYLVHGILSVSATLYSIVLGVPLFSTEKVAYIQKQPRKQATIVGRHFWYKYDHRHRLFHYIALKERKPELEFCTVSLREARPKVFVKSLMSMFFGVTTKNMLSPSWSAYPLPYSIGVTNENLVPQLPCVTPVVLPASRSVCVCVQHELDRRDPDHLLIPVSIVPLKIQSRIDYAIPVPEEVADPERLRVLFATIADFLMVFVPNVYLHLLDISDLHNPISGLILTGKETASFPHGTGTSETLQSGASLACIDTSYRNEAKPNGPRMLEHTFVDLKTGVMCEFEFDKKNLLRLIGAGLSPEKALHIALLHFRDEELADQVMHDVLNSPSQRISPDLFKEYILSHTFLSLRKDLPQQVLMGAPSTVVEQSDYLFVKNKQMNVCTPQELFALKKIIIIHLYFLFVK